MMKRLLSLFVAILATTALWAYDFKYGDLCYNITSSSYPYTVEVTYEVSPASTGNNYYNLQTATIPPQVSNNGITYNVTSIGELAFNGAWALRSITIPYSVKKIGSNIVRACSKSLVSIVVDDANTVYDSRNNCNAIIETNSNKLIAGCKTSTIPHGVKSIADRAFSLNTRLSSIVIPNSVTYIGAHAFSCCTSLTSVSIPNSVKSIGRQAFWGCSSLESVTISTNTQIGEAAFNVCHANLKINRVQPQSTNHYASNHTHHQYVDLGLSVKWATCNVGASKPEEYGDYFAWGEVKPKEVYDWSTYKWCNGSEESLTKYDGYFDIFDISFELELSDDVAHTNWGGDWRMPTAEDFIELIEQCTWTRATLNGVKGRKVTGPNGNSIFLPDVGIRKGDWCGGKIGAYWSSWKTSTGVESNGSEAYHLHWLPLELDGDGKYIDPLDRCVGCSVRPVCP